MSNGLGPKGFYTESDREPVQDKINKQSYTNNTPDLIRTTSSIMMNPFVQKQQKQ